MEADKTTVVECGVVVIKIRILYIFFIVVSTFVHITTSVIPQHTYFLVCFI